MRGKARISCHARFLLVLSVGIAFGSQVFAADLSACGAVDPDKHWALARKIEDLSRIADVDIPTSFSRAGWQRVAERLASISAAGASNDAGAIVSSLLAGADHDKYCAQLGALGTSAAALDVPLSLLQARDVAAAIFPYLADLAEEIAKSPDQDVANNAVLKAIRQVATDDRLAAELDLFAEDLSSGSLKISRPSDWPPNEAWPPSKSRIVGLSSALSHTSTREARICSPSVPTRSLSKDIALNRVLAMSIKRQVEGWAKSCAVVQVGVERPKIPDAPRPISPYVVPDAVAPSASAHPTLLLVPSPTNPSRYSVGLSMLIQGARVQWPLGVVINDVAVGPNGDLSVLSSALLPSVPNVDLDALTGGLRKIGLPEIVSISNANVIGLDQHIKNMSLSLSVQVGPLFANTVTMTLMEDGRAVDLKAQMKSTLDTIAKGFVEQLRKNPPKLRFANSEISVSPSMIDLDMNRATAVIDGIIQLDLTSFGVGEGKPISAFVKLSTELGGSTFKLVESRWPSEVIERIKQKLLSVLPAEMTGASSCIGLTGLWLTLDEKAATLQLAAELTQDGRAGSRIALNASSPFTDLIAHFTQELASDIVKQCVVRRILAMTDAAAAEALEALQTKTIKIADLQFAVRNARVANNKDKLQFRADLVSTDDPLLQISGITIDGTWRSTDDLPLTAIGVEGVSLSGDFVKRLLARVEPTLTNWISIRQVAFARGKLTLTGSITIPALSKPVTFENLALDLTQAKAAIAGIFEQAALTALDEQAASFKDQLASMGSIKSIGLDKSSTHLIGNFDVVFKVAVEPVSNVVLPFRVHLPSFKVEAEDFKNVLVSSALGFLSNALGGLNIPGSGVSNIQPVIDNDARRYGVSFDAGANLADAFSVKLSGVLVDQHGIELPDSFALSADDFISIPPYLGIGNLGGTVWVRPPGKFGVNATLLLAFDVPGWIIAFPAVVIGNGPQQTVEAEGNLLIFRIPLFRAKGVVDFRSQVITADAETLSPLSAILAMKTTSKLDAKARVITANSEVSLLGLKTAGALQVHLADDKLVLITGTANWNTLGVQADLTLRTTTEFHSPTAEGHAQLGFIGVGANFGIDLSHVKLGFRWLGIGLTVIAPSVERIDQRLIENLIASLFDFKFSLDQLKTMNIVVNLVDKNGKGTSASYGGGDAPGSDGEGSEQQTGQGGGPEAKGSVQGSTTSGSITGSQPVSDGCSNKGKNRVWVQEPQLAGDSIEGNDPGKGTVYISSDARIISEPMKKLLNDSVLLQCFERENSSRTRFHLKFSDGTAADIRSDKVAVLVPRTGPKQLMALEFAKGSTAIPIVLPAGAENMIFGNGGLANATTWKSRRADRALLKKIVIDQLEGQIKIEAVHQIPNATTIIPGWEPKVVSLFVEKKAGQTLIELTSEDESVLLGPDHPLFSPLTANPSGVLTQLAASVQPLHKLRESPPPITVRGAQPGCQLALVDTGTMEHYAVAYTDGNFNVARLIDADSWTQSGGNWLDPYCKQLVSLGPRADLRIARSHVIGNGSQAMLAARSVAAQPEMITWWVSTATKAGSSTLPTAPPSPATITGSMCLREQGMKAKFPVKSPAFRDNFEIDWSSPSREGIDEMLFGLSGDWEKNFKLNVRGLFLVPEAADGPQICPP